MINPDDLFELFPDESSDLSQEMLKDDKYVNFDKGRMLGSVIIRKVDDLIKTYKAFDNVEDSASRDRIKDKALALYNKTLLSYLKKINNIHKVRGLAYEDAKHIPSIIDTLTKYYERTEEFSNCTYLVNLKQDLLVQDLTRSLWVSDYEPIP